MTGGRRERRLCADAGEWQRRWTCRAVAPAEARSWTAIGGATSWPAPQHGSVLEQRPHRDLESGGDHTPEVLGLGADDVERRRRAEVDDDARSAEQVDGADGVDDPVGPDLPGIVVKDRHPGADPGFDDEQRPRTSRWPCGAAPRSPTGPRTRRRRSRSPAPLRRDSGAPAAGNEIPAAASSWTTIRACTSLAVRSGSVEIRQLWASPGSSPAGRAGRSSGTAGSTNTPITVWVLPTSMARSIVERSTRSRGHRAGSGALRGHAATVFSPRCRGRCRVSAPSA